MNISRRQFSGHLVAGSLGLALAGVGGCTAQTAIAELESWAPVGLAAFDGLAAIVDTVFTSIAATTDALWAALSNAINYYQHSTDPTTTKLDKVIATLDALSAGLTQALAALPISIPAAVLSAAKLGLALLIATLKNIQAKLEPVPTPVPASVKAAIGTTAPATSKADFITKWNAIMTANGVTATVR